MALRCSPLLHAAAPAAAPTRLAAGRRRRRAGASARAQLVVEPARPQPQPQPEPQPDHGHAPAAADEPQLGDACPFLAGLAATPKRARMPLLQRFEQIFNPAKFQAALLAGEQRGTLVTLPQQLTFPEMTVLNDPEAVRDALAGEATGHTAQATAQMPSLTTLLGLESLLLVQDPQHRYLRGLLQPAFSAEAVAGYLPAIDALVARHLQEWAATDGGVRAFNAFKALTFEFITELTFGRRCDKAELQYLTDTYAVWAQGFMAWPWLNIPFTPFGRAVAARGRMIEHFSSQVAAGRAALAAAQPVGGLLGKLLTAVDEDGNTLTDSQICSNMLLLLLAGHDTSSTTLTLAMNNLQNHPAVLERLRAEQREIVARHGEALSAAALKDMVYADAVIRETLRLDPVVMGLFRLATKDLVLGGAALPAGTLLLLPFKHLAATDPRWAHEAGELHAEVFNPERMLGSEGAKPGSLVPFGHGPRYCLGAGLAMAEMKVFLAQLARHYTAEVDNNTEWRQAIGRVPKNGLPMVVRRLEA